MTAGPLTQSQAEARANEALSRLRSGDAAGAYERASALAAAPPGTPVPWLLLAQAAQATGRDREAADALERQLATAPRDLRALVMMAALQARAGDDRAAVTFYRTALAVATQPGAQVPTDLVPMLRDGEQFLADAERRFGRHLEDAVASARLDTGRGGARIRQALDLMFGRSEIYQQQPSMFYFPGLAQRAFFERDEFGWLPAVEAAVPEIRRELAAAMAGDAGFDPYVQATPGRPLPANPLLNDPSWSAYHLWRSGEPVEANARACPATMRALEHAPIPVIAGRSPMAIFSRLTPGTHIRPHHGLLNTRLICHVPLVVPPGCAIRVGAETREWREDEALVFDDSFEHEAWNRGTSTRVVLLFEIWRPELTEGERAALTGIFEAIDQYQGAATDAG